LALGFCLLSAWSHCDFDLIDSGRGRLPAAATAQDFPEQQGFPQVIPNLESVRPNCIILGSPTTSKTKSWDILLGSGVQGQKQAGPHDTNPLSRGIPMCFAEWQSSLVLNSDF
jgi:hypothetical protein